MKKFDHLERILDGLLVKKIYRNEVDGKKERKRQPASWEGNMREYIGKRTKEGVRGMEKAREACPDGTAWRTLYHGHSSERSSQEE